MSDLKGICVPVCTPFDKSGDGVDEGALAAHVDTLLDARVHVILSCGGTGEFAGATGEMALSAIGTDGKAYNFTYRIK